MGSVRLQLDKKLHDRLRFLAIKTERPLFELMAQFIEDGAKAEEKRLAKEST